MKVNLSPDMGWTIQPRKMTKKARAKVSKAADRAFGSVQPATLSKEMKANKVFGTPVKRKK